MKKIAVVLAGSGVYDGAEIHEATLTLLAIDQCEAKYQCFAPDIDQAHVINHISGEIMSEKRNVLIESARIARGDIKPLSAYDAAEYDAIVFPGGFGVAKNLCTYAFDGTDCTVLPKVEKVIKETLSLNKPIGALCIAPVIIAKLIDGVKVTVGSDDQTVKAIKSFGGDHRLSSHGEVVVDLNNKVVTTPCYMLDASISQIADGAKKLIEKVLELT